VRLAGSNFQPTTVANWGAVPCDGSAAAACSTTYDPATGDVVVQLDARFFTLTGATDVLVQNSNGLTSTAIPFFVTETAVAVSKAVTTTSTGGPVSVTTDASSGPGSVSATASGTGTLSVAQYTANPMQTSSPSGTTAWFDVHVAGGTFSSLTVVQCSTPATAPAPILYWWDATAAAWTLVSNQVADAPTVGCTTATLDTSASSSPTTLQLTGTEFASAPLTEAGLCGLTARFVQGSARYQGLRAADRLRVDALAQTACQRLAGVSLSGPNKVRLVTLYQTEVQGLAAAGWLTVEQANRLGRLAARL
jgi:hypothetical protein